MGSRRAPIPVDAPTGFLSAMNLITKDQLHQDYAPRSREPSKTPSLQDFAYRDPSEDAKSVATGKLRKPTKKLSLATGESAGPAEETAVPAPKKPRKRAAAKTDDNAVDPPETVPKRGRPRKAVASAPETADGQVPAPAPVKRGRKKATVDQEDNSAETAAPAPKRPRKKAAKADAVNDGAEGADVVEAVPKPKKPPAKSRAPRKTKAALQAEAAEREAQSAFQPWQPPTAPGNPSETTAATVNNTSGSTVSAADKVKKPTKPRVRKATAPAEADTATGKHGPESALKPWDAPLEATVDPVRHGQSELPNVADTLIRKDYTVETAKSVETIDLDHAPRRRMNWTPPPANLAPTHSPNFYENNDKDAHSPVSVDAGITSKVLQVDTSGPLAATDNAILAEESPKPLSFADLMGNFGYQRGEADLLLQRADGEPATKRRRIEPVAAKAKPEKVSKKKEPKKKADPKPKKLKESKPPKEPKKKAEPKPKKPRAPPKKPLTITALATAAYRLQVVQPESADAAKVTSYFQAESGQEEQAGETSAQANLASTKRKPSKPPAKFSKKAQAALVAAQYRLESPETAHRSMRNQDWLFGTSSQLAAAESPSEYRDLQRAIKESEEFVGSQEMEGSQALDALRPVSRMRVPSAPHGTDLSIGQAHRDLWLSAARDFEENTFASNEGLGIVMEENEAAFPLMEAPGLSIFSKRPFVQEDETQDSGCVDIDDISSIIGDKQKGLALLDQADQRTARDGVRHITEAENTHLMPSTETEAVFERVVLKRLDPNASMSRSHMDVDSKPSSPIKPPISKFAAEPTSLLSSPTKPLRGRPRKAVIDLSSPPKQRGRPSKSLQPFSDPTPLGPEQSFLIEHSATQPQPQNVESSPYLDIDDIVARAPLNSERSPLNTQPAKRHAFESSPYLDIDDVAVSSPERPLLHRHTASQPAPHSSPYLDIDDISDAEAASAPPSPPKLTKGKTPAIQDTLELSNPAAVPPVKPRSDKQLQADFAVISPTLYPKITAVVKGAPRTKDPKHPSWWEKMLLYDPIVLEDLTAWLSAQGVKIETERERVVVKAKKGRKRKNADADQEAVEEQAVAETEIVREELRCWMVQRWCEENSVCCLWREGMRGGVKQKY